MFSPPTGNFKLDLSLILHYDLSLEIKPEQISAGRDPTVLYMVSMLSIYLFTEKKST